VAAPTAQAEPRALPPAPIPLDRLVAIVGILIGVIVVLWQIPALFSGKPSTPVRTVESPTTPSDTKPVTAPPTQPQPQPKKPSPAPVASTPAGGNWPPDRSEQNTVEQTRTYTNPEVSTALISSQILLKKAEVQHQETWLSVPGEWTIPSLPQGTKGIPIQCQLWDVWKESSYAESVTFVDKPNFEAQLGLTRPLQPGFYYVKMMLSSAHAEPEIQRMIANNLSEWWLPVVVGDTRQTRQAVNQSIQELSAALVEIHAQYEELQKICKMSLPQIQPQWVGWATRWQKKQTQLMEKWKQPEDKYLVPFCAAMYRHFVQLLEHLQRFYSEVDGWVQGFSLIPPDMLVEEGKFQSMEAGVQKFFADRKQMLQGLIEKK
jgi:hypothetical protein